jgi:DNA repair exonuclease SbcCD nuclease subunit
MRFLHTSDWHLGRSFHGSSLLEEQAAALARMVELAREGEVDAVLIAGDIYDRAIPPAEAVRLFNDTLVELRGTGAVVVAIAGNHDSHVRVSVYDPLLSAFGVSIRGDVRRAERPVIVIPKRGGAPVAIYPLPYLDPSVDGPALAGTEWERAAAHGSVSDRLYDGFVSDGSVSVGVADGFVVDGIADGAVIGDSLGGDVAQGVLFDGLKLDASEGNAPEGSVLALPRATATDPPAGRLRHEHVTRLALARLRRDLQTRPGHRSVVVAHTFVAGGVGCESERELTVGNVDRVSVEAFAGFDAVALGHLHRAQELDGPRLAYCGSPLPYSFSEEGQRKSVRLVELGADGPPRVEVVPLEVGRPLATIEGEIEQLLRDPALEKAEGARVRVILTDEALPLQAKARLQRRFPHIAELRHRPPEVERCSISERHRRVRQTASPLDLLTAFFTDQQGRPATAVEEQLLRRALEAAGGDGGGDSHGIREHGSREQSSSGSGESDTGSSSRESGSSSGSDSRSRSRSRSRSGGGGRESGSGSSGSGGTASGSGGGDSDSRSAGRASGSGSSESSGGASATVGTDSGSGGEDNWGAVGDNRSDNGNDNDNDNDDRGSFDRGKSGSGLSGCSASGSGSGSSVIVGRVSGSGGRDSSGEDNGGAGEDNGGAGEDNGSSNGARGGGDRGKSGGGMSDSCGGEEP